MAKYTRYEKTVFCSDCGIMFCVEFEEEYTATQHVCYKCERERNKMDATEKKEDKLNTPVDATGSEKKKPQKGFRLDAKVGKEQKRLGATGLSVKDGKIIYHIPKEVKEQRAKDFDKKKKAKKLAKKNKKRNRR